MKPQKQKTLLIRMSPDLHKKMRLISVKNECSLNQYVINAFKEIVAQDEKGIKKWEKILKHH